MVLESAKAERSQASYSRTGRAGGASIFGCLWARTSASTRAGDPGWLICPQAANGPSALKGVRKHCALTWHSFLIRAGPMTYRHRSAPADYCGCRDLDDVGGTNISVVALNKLPYGSLSERVQEGVVFLTYSSLISSSDKVPTAWPSA